MPRQARLDAPGTLHHVIGRGIERSEIFRNDFDRADFLGRVEDLSREGSWIIYAWAFLSNHFHLLVRTGKQGLPKSMRKLLTGYVVNFNRRHGRFGHLFQNRYKSIVCEDDPYLLELTRYIHLNPLRAGLVKNLEELKRYPWAGHSVLMGVIKRDWQDRETILSFFGRTEKRCGEKLFPICFRRGPRGEKAGFSRGRTGSEYGRMVRGTFIETKGNGVGIGCKNLRRQRFCFPVIVGGRAKREGYLEAFKENGLILHLW